MSESVFVGVDVQIRRGCCYYATSSSGEHLQSGWIASDENCARASCVEIDAICGGVTARAFVGIDAPRMALPARRPLSHAARTDYGVDAAHRAALAESVDDPRWRQDANSADSRDARDHGARLCGRLSWTWLDTQASTATMMADCRAGQRGLVVVFTDSFDSYRRQAFAERAPKGPHAEMVMPLKGRLALGEIVISNVMGHHSIAMLTRDRDVSPFLELGTQKPLR